MSIEAQVERLNANLEALIAKLDHIGGAVAPVKQLVEQPSPNASATSTPPAASTSASKPVETATAASPSDSLGKPAAGAAAPAESNSGPAPTATTEAPAPAEDNAAMYKKIVDLFRPYAGKNRDAALALLAKYGATKGPDLKPEHYPAIYAELQKVAA